MCLIDAHVHFHALARVEPTLEAAVRNFRVHGTADGLAGVLLLTQTAGERIFETLVERPASGAWQFAPARAEPTTLIARRDGAAIAIVCGRQLRTAEALEVLALGTVARFPDGLSLDEAVAAVRETDALAVLPWGFGKWVGGRGRRIDRMLAPECAAWLFVGDNGGRLALAGLPTLLGTAERRGYRILPGTDPFPVGSDYDRVGSFGCRLDIEPAPEAPWRTVRAAIMSLRGSPQRFGRACGALRFLHNQVGVRLQH